LLIFLVALRPLFSLRNFSTRNQLLEALLFSVELPHYIYLGLQILMKGLSVIHVEIIDMIDGSGEGVEISMEVNACQISCLIERLQERI
jgi:hypothetical protein